MLNPILSQLNNPSGNNNNQPLTSAQIQPYKNMMRQIQNAPDQQQALQNMLMQNPNVAQISQLLKFNGGSLQQVAQYMANQRGIDLNALIRELQS